MSSWCYWYYEFPRLERRVIELDCCARTLRVKLGEHALKHAHTMRMPYTRTPKQYSLVRHACHTEKQCDTRHACVRVCMRLCVRASLAHPSRHDGIPRCRRAPRCRMRLQHARQCIAESICLCCVSADASTPCTQRGGKMCRLLLQPIYYVL